MHSNHQRCEPDCPMVGNPEGSWIDQDEGTLHVHWEDVMAVDGITAVTFDIPTSTMFVQLKGDYEDTETYRSFTFSPEGLMHTISVLLDVAHEADWTWVTDQVKAHLSEITKERGPWPIP